MFVPLIPSVAYTYSQAGQERFRTLSTSFYRGAHGVILVYDISSRASFLSLEKWFEEAEMNTVSNVALYLVGSRLHPNWQSFAVHNIDLGTGWDQARQIGQRAGRLPGRGSSAGRRARGEILRG